jgi:hypothetical protein
MLILLSSVPNSSTTPTVEAAMIGMVTGQINPHLGDQSPAHTDAL